MQPFLEVRVGRCRTEDGPMWKKKEVGGGGCDEKGFF